MDHPALRRWRGLGLAVLLVAAGLPAMADDSPHTLKEPKVLVIPQATGAACAVMERQFDSVIEAHAGKPKAVPARELRKTGEQKCNQGDYDGGVADLSKALKDIHVKPDMP